MVPTRCAVCQLSDGLVVNMIIALPSDPAPEGCQLVEVINDQPCDMGWFWTGSEFVLPPEEAPSGD